MKFNAGVRVGLLFAAGILIAALAAIIVAH